MKISESVFQSKLVKELYDMFPECIVLLNNPEHRQGIPDLLILWGKLWAALECKASESARRRPNQSYYVKKMNDMSFAAFIHPANKKDVLHDLQQAFESGRGARVSGA